MIDVAIFVSGGDNGYSTGERFASRPDAATIKALLDEARATFKELYDCEPETLSVDVQPADAELTFGS